MKLLARRTVCGLLMSANMMFPMASLGFFMKISIASTLKFGTVATNMSGKILYFAFGSNLSADRMHVCNPNATRLGAGKLKDYQIDFVAYSKIWKGYAGTIVPKKGGHVWGAIWEIKDEDLESLDRQEGVHANVYYPIAVDVETPEGKVLKCRCYRQVGNADMVDLKNLPEERKPTPAYLDTMIKGAEESGIPSDYINFLKNIPHNGSDVKPNLKFQY